MAARLLYLKGINADERKMNLGDSVSFGSSWNFVQSSSVVHEARGRGVA